MTDTPESGVAGGETRLRRLGRELEELRARLRQGGGPDRIQRQHDQGKLTARERLERLLDPGSTWFEVGLLVAYDLYEGGAPGAGVVTGVGCVSGREVVVVANDATVKAGAWWPETIKKIKRTLKNHELVEVDDPDQEADVVVTVGKRTKAI